MAAKQELLRQLDEAHLDFRSTVEDLDEHAFDTKWLDKRWGAREVAAHITGWHGKLASGLERMSRGERPVPEGEDWSDTQSFNDTFAQHAKGKLRDEVLSELASAVDRFKHTMEHLPDERFEDGKTATKMVDGAGISHFHEHAEMIRAWRKREGL